MTEVFEGLKVCKYSRNDKHKLWVISFFSFYTIFILDDVSREELL